jgi:hypothetical protein
MALLWEYFILSFPAAPRGLKKIRKARNIEEYRAIVHEVISSG